MQNFIIPRLLIQHLLNQLVRTQVGHVLHSQYIAWRGLSGHLQKALLTRCWVMQHSPFTRPPDCSRVTSPACGSFREEPLHKWPDPPQPTTHGPPRFPKVCLVYSAIPLGDRNKLSVLLFRLLCLRAIIIMGLILSPVPCYLSGLHSWSREPAIPVCLHWE